LSDLIARLPAAALQGLIDHMGRSWLFFDIDPTHMTTLEHPDSADPTRPPVQHPRAQVAAPGYPGRKRADAIRSRMTVLLSHAQMWALTFAQPGNGQRTPAVERACDTVADPRPSAGATSRVRRSRRRRVRAGAEHRGHGAA